jgi:hypothetical protein
MMFMGIIIRDRINILLPISNTIYIELHRIPKIINKSPKKPSLISISITPNKIKKPNPTKNKKY